MTTPEILTFLLLFCAVSYLVSGLISVRNIIRYRRMAVDLDEDVISRSPFQPSISIVVKLDLRKEKPLDKIEKLLQMRYRNYDVIAVCNSRVDPKEFGRILRRFRLEPDPSGTLYASTDETWSRLRVADRPIHRTKRIIECGISLSRKRYIVPIYDIDCILSPNSLSKTATLIMREPEGRALNLTGAHRYITDGSFRLAVADDIFLYKNETRRVIEPKTSSSSSSYSGGTTTDSRGRSGRSGKF